MGYTDISLGLSIVFVIAGLVALAWSSDFFVDGAASLARTLGISPFVIGMVIIGFGTSAPELCVSAMSGISGHSSLSLGNAYGSCIFNIAIVLGVAVMIFPLVVKPAVSLVAGPGLAAITAFSYIVLSDGVCSRVEASILLTGFFVLLPLYCWFDQKTKGDLNEHEADKEESSKTPIWSSMAKVLVGLTVLIGSSHLLVWGSVDLAKAIGVSDLVIGLTIVAVGTSLPELASAIASARRGEHEFVLGNIIGSNLFNTLAVVGIATVISPTDTFSHYILTRDLPLMFMMSLSIMVFGLNWRHFRWPGVIRRRAAAIWIVVFVLYTICMFYQEVHG